MITTSQYKYKGSFIDNAGHTIRMEIESPYLTEDKTFIFGPDPLHITWSNDNMYDGATGRKLTAQIVGDSFTLFDGLSGDWPMDVAVKCYNDNVLFFYGFLSNDDYNLSYSNNMRTFTIDVLDPILVGDMLPYGHTNSEARKLLILTDVFKAFCTKVGITKFYYGLDDTTTLFSEDAFLPSNWDEKWREGNGWRKWSEVLKGLGQSFGANIFVDSDILYVCPVVETADSQTSFDCTLFQYTTTWKETINQHVDMNVLSSNANYDMMNDVVADSTSLTISKAKSSVIRSVDSSNSRSLISDPFDITRWSNDPLEITISDLTLRKTVFSEDGKKKVTLSTFDRNESSKDIPYCYDWFGRFGIVSEYSKNDNGNTYELKDRKLVLYSVYTRPCAERITCVGCRAADEGWSSNFKMYIEMYDQDMLSGLPSMSGTSYNRSGSTSFTSKIVFSEKNKYFASDVTIAAGRVHLYIESGQGAITGIKLEDNTKDSIKSEYGRHNNNSYYAEASVSTLLYPYDSPSAAGCMSKNFWLNYSLFSKAYRLYQFTSHKNGLNVRPFSHGVFNEAHGQIVEADIDLMDNISNYSLLVSSYTKPSPAPVGPWYLTSVDLVTIGSYSGTTEVPSTGGSYLLEVKVVCTIHNGSGQTLQVSGSTSNIYQNYGVSLTAVLSSKMVVAMEETTPRGYLISGNTITIDEWPLSEIDERYIYVWATCNSVTSSNVVFHQQPNYDDEI